MSGDRWYRRLLRLLPFDMRSDYGRDMEQVFREERRDAGRRGAHGAAIAWAHAVADIRAIGPREHAAQIAQDVRYTLRTMRRQAGFVVIALMTLALGIGANTAIFSIVHAVMLAPLPYGRPDTLVSVSNHWSGNARGGMSDPEYLDYAERSRGLRLAAMSGVAMNLVGGTGDPERVTGAVVTANTFDVLGMQPVLGRGFAEGEDREGRTNVVLLSDALWRRRFAADPAIVGRVINVDGVSCTVIGVLGAAFQLPIEFGAASRVDLVRPIRLDPAAPRIKRGGHYLDGVARLQPGVTVRAAAAEMDGINASLMREYPDQYKQGGFGIGVTPLREALLGDSRPVILILAGAVGLVLLIACANVANLLLARGESRGRELAVRTALGASRFRIIRQLLTESVLLSLAGAAAGLAVASWCQRAILTIAPAALPRLASVSLDRPVLLFATALGVTTGVLFGLIPAARVSRVPVTASLKDGGRGSTDAGRRRVRQALVVTQVAIAVVLLVAGGLLLKSFTRVMAQPAGVDTARVLTFRISLPAARYAGRPEVAGFFSRLLDRVAALPGVQSSGAATGLPLALASGDWSFDVEGQPRPDGRHSGAADWYVVTPGYFETLGIRVVRGRAPVVSDDESTAPSVFLNETAARVFFPNADPIGRRLQMTRTTGSEQPWRTIAGVVSDVRQRGLEEAPRAELFIPYRQFQHFSAGVQARAMTVMVKTSGDPLSLATAVREQLRALDPEVPAAQMRDMEMVLSQSVAPRRLNVLLIGAFAILALTLALIGLYGVIAYTVQQRTREIGVRMAVGASRRSVLRLVVGDAMRLTTVGVALGLALALAFGGVLTGLLFQVGPRDLPTLALVGALLPACAALASYIPARRAMRVDPVVALRAE
jgi:putative ABC transport system permease protein